MTIKPTYEELEQRIKELEKENVERRRAEKELHVASDNLFNILASMEDGVYIVNQEYDIQYVNPAIEKEFGPIDKRKCYEYFHDREEVCPWCKNPEVFAGKTVRWEWYSFKNQRIYDLIDTPLKNSDGSLSKLEIFRDITEMKQAEEKIKQQAEFLNLVIESLPHPFCVIDASDYSIKLANSAAQVGDLSKNQTCQSLSHLVVQLQGDSPSFFFLGCNKLRREKTESLLRLL